MKLKNAILALSACSLIGVPVAAQAGTTASASVGKVAKLPASAVRYTVPVDKKKKDGEGGASVYLLGGLGALAVAGGVIALTDGSSGS